jgi:radical SAM protein with 4Fe4S-binding SPASM domain
MIADDFLYLLTKWQANGKIYITGGDPLLSPYFFELCDYMNDIMPEGTRIGILGNPEPIDKAMAIKIQSLRPYFYQLSLDGREIIHDYVRYTGSFRETLRAIKVLKEQSIKTAVMFTISNLNYDDLLYIIDIVAENGVNFFDFARFAPLNSAKRLDADDTLIDPLKYRDLLCRVLDKYRQYDADSNCITRFGRKDPLWSLLEYETGKLKLVTDRSLKDLVIGGCNIGAMSVSILHDGTVLGCRRVPIPIGKVPDQSLTEIFIKSNELNKMRKIEEIQKCNQCELLHYCRGCRAVPYGYFGSFFAPDPQCWKS